MDAHRAVGLPQDQVPALEGREDRTHSLGVERRQRAARLRLLLVEPALLADQPQTDA